MGVRLPVPQDEDAEEEGDKKMPLPKRKKGEDKKTFIQKCMKDKIMLKEFKDNKQRVAVCFDLSRKKYD